MIKAKLCECGCGEYAKPGNRFIYNHHRKNVKTSDKTKEKQSIVHKKQYEENPVSGETKKKLSDATKKRYEDPDEHIKSSNAAKKRWQENPSVVSDETKEKQSKSHKKRYEDPEERKKTSESGKKRYEENPVSDEIKEKMSKSASKRFKKIKEENLNGGKGLLEETCKKISATKQGIPYNEWKDFLKPKYCFLFNPKFKEKIRILYNRKCFMCGKSEEENGRRLDVHHVNYDKDCLCGSRCEFIPLCRSCHTKTGNNRKYWEDLIMCYLYPEKYFMGDI